MDLALSLYLLSIATDGLIIISQRMIVCTDACESQALECYLCHGHLAELGLSSAAVLTHMLQEGGRARPQKGQIAAQPKNFLTRPSPHGGPGMPRGTISQLKHTSGVVRLQSIAMLGESLVHLQTCDDQPVTAGNVSGILLALSKHRSGNTFVHTGSGRCSPQQSRGHFSIEASCTPSRTSTLMSAFHNSGLQ